MTNISKPIRYGFLLLVLNAGYLFSTNAATLFYAANVLVHVLLGGALALVSLRLFRARPAGLVLGAAAVTGVALVILGNGTATRSLLWAHIGIAALAASVVVYRLRSGLAATAMGVACLMPIVSALRGEKPPELNTELPPVSMEGEALGGADGPFFPSSAETADGKLVPSRFFLGSKECGRCHTDIYEEWESSAHRRASFNNQWYRKSIEYMQSVVGTTPSKWCGGCHDHAVLFTGMMDQPVSELLDQPEAHAGLSCTSCHSIVRIKNTMGNGGFVIEYPDLHDLATSQNVLVRAVHDFVLHLDPEPHRETFLKPLHTGDSSAFCSSCHKVHLDVPVNNYRWIRGFNSYDNWQASGVSGEGARSFYYPDAPSTCKDCHMPLVPGDDPAAPDGMLRSHRFAAANTALPTAYRDEAQLKAVTDFLKAGQVSVDLFALVRSDAPSGQDQDALRDAPQIASTFAVGEEAEMTAPTRMSAVSPEEQVVAPIDEAAPVLVRGESVRIDAVVRTRKVGHFFPSGTVDAFDVWLELKATDETGRIFFWSGRAEEDGKGAVEPGAHFYRSLLIDAKGQPINKRNAWAARSTLYAQLIPPGAANTVRFRLEVPEDIGSTVRLEARLNYRKFAWWHTQWAYAGVREGGVEPEVTADYDLGQWTFEGDLGAVSGVLKEIPDVPTVIMAEATVELTVADALPDVETSVSSVENGLRWNDYGIGLLLQGDLRGAERAFRRVTGAMPEYADGWVNVARVQVQEGDPEGAREALDEALERDPDLAKSHYFYGLALKTEGRYDEALSSFRRAASIYPRDRVVRNQIARLHFLKREYDQAIGELDKTLRIDPEDLEAHYNLMLAHQGKGDMELASHHRELYLRFKADEASQFLTGDYRRHNPDDNNERLPIHEHRSVTIP